jgi:hypothetical protein
MAYSTKSIASRIEWCRRQKPQACTQLELAGWQAEEEGLRTRSSTEITRPSISRVRSLCSSGMRWVSRTDTRCFALPRRTIISQPPPIGHRSDPGSIQESHGGRAACLP